MDSQINTGGGAAIQGDVNADGNVVFRDQYNFSVVVNLLQSVGVEGILPNIQQAESFNRLTKAIESALGDRFSNDLTKATAFAGEILGDFIPTQMANNPDKPPVLHRFVSNLVNHIGKRLTETGYWEAFARSIYVFSNPPEPPVAGLVLQATNAYWEKQLASRRNFYIGHQYNNKKYPFALFVNLSNDSRFV